MNCKPGDVALVVRSDYPENIGRLCLVTKQWQVDDDGDHCWLCRFPSRILAFDVQSFGDLQTRNSTVPDAWLRPLRDPGEDAVDQTLIWKSVPSSTKESA